MELTGCTFKEEMALARAARERRDRVVALEHFRAAAALEPNDIWAICEIGHELRELGRLDEAEGHYRKIVAERPHIVGAWRGLALIARKRGDRAVAAENFQNARALEPSSPWLAWEAAEDSTGKWGGWTRRKSFTTPPCR